MRNIFFNQLFNELASGLAASTEASFFREKTVNFVISEDDKQFYINAYLPAGIEKQHVKVNVEGGAVRITIKKDTNPTPEGQKILHDERSSTDISRLFNFYHGLHYEGHGASIVDGKLSISLQKANAIVAKDLEIK